jgi:uncharacterized protein involved in propanediol utilization
MANATAVLTAEQRSIEVAPAWKVNARKAARLTLDALELRETGAHVVVDSAIPVGRGFGSSTSDVVATVRAIASAAGAQLEEAEVALLAVESEIASDPLMFERVVLFAQRDGILLEDFGTPFPAIEVLGFSTSGHETGVRTLEFPPACYSTSEADEFEELRLRLRCGLAQGDLTAIGRVATESARLNQRHLPFSRLEELIKIADSASAVGVQVAHRGDVGGLLFDPKDAELEKRLREAQERLSAAGTTNTWRFRTA